MSETRPSYGEYATPEEQRRRIDSNPLPDEPPRQEPKPRQEPEVSQATAAAPTTVTDDSPKPLTRARRIDVFAAVFLLAWGLFSVIRMVPELTQLPSTFYDAFEAMGIDAEFSDPAGARWWGVGAAVVYGFGWLIAAALTWRRARQRKIVFWVPLVSAVVVFVIVMLLIAVPLANDPALLDALVSQMGELPQP
ncbi:DUF6264 family protein [Microbacterium sp.]|uniref:DUF6264 family protein n=2 Tax=Microbacterium sp. TaxID=51671 RepID=UPI003F9E25AC